MNGAQNHQFGGMMDFSEISKFSGRQVNLSNYLVTCLKNKVDIGCSKMNQIKY